MPEHDHKVNSAETEMASLLAVQKIMQSELPLRPIIRVEKALSFLVEKEAELKKLGHEPSTEFNLFITQLSKAYTSEDNTIPPKAVNGVILRVNQALLPENANRLVSKDPALANGDEKTKLLATAQTNSAIIRDLNTAHNHVGKEKCGDEICTSSMAATAVFKQSSEKDKEALKQVANGRK